MTVSTLTVTSPETAAAQRARMAMKAFTKHVWTKSTTSTACSGGGTNSGSDVGNEVFDVYGLKALGEKARPEWLHGNVSGL